MRRKLQNNRDKERDEEYLMVCEEAESSCSDSESDSDDEREPVGFARPGSKYWRSRGLLPYPGFDIRVAYLESTRSPDDENVCVCWFYFIWLATDIPRCATE